MNVASHDLPAEAYPFTVALFDEQHEVRWSRTIDEPPARHKALIEVPGLRDNYGPIASVVVFATGEVQTHWPDDFEAPPSDIQLVEIIERAEAETIG